MRLTVLHEDELKVEYCNNYSTREFVGAGTYGQFNVYGFSDGARLVMSMIGISDIPGPQPLMGGGSTHMDRVLVKDGVAFNEYSISQRYLDLCARFATWGPDADVSDSSKKREDYEAILLALRELEDEDMIPAPVIRHLRSALA